MAIHQLLLRGTGHPFTGERGWDMLEAKADSDAELDRYIAAAARKFWKVWIRSSNGERVVALYKPAGRTSDWVDVPGHTNISRLVAEALASTAHSPLQLLLARLEHFIRQAADVDSMRQRLLGAVDAYGATNPSHGVDDLRAYVDVIAAGGPDWRCLAFEQLEALRSAVGGVVEPSMKTAVLPSCGKPTRQIRP